MSLRFNKLLTTVKAQGRFAHQKLKYAKESNTHYLGCWQCWHPSPAKTSSVQSSPALPQWTVQSGRSCHAKQGPPGARIVRKPCWFQSSSGPMWFHFPYILHKERQDYIQIITPPKGKTRQSSHKTNKNYPAWPCTAQTLVIPKESKGYLLVDWLGYLCRWTILNPSASFSFAVSAPRHWRLWAPKTRQVQGCP